MRVWDREGYEVIHCAKGLCASVAAGRLKGLLAEEVSMDDGELKAYYIDATKHVLLKGSVNEIFEGTIQC